MIDLDLEHLGLPGAICAYVLPGPEPAIVDPGPATTLATLEEKLAGRGILLADVRHLLLTHVHLDHAGAAGHLAARSPKLQVHVHVDGAPHVADPERLVASTRRTFGEAHDRLWGEVRAVPAERIRAWEPGRRGPFKGLRPLATPGHIGHHVAYLDEQDGVLFSGDAMGIVLSEGAPTHPPTPPPAVDLDAWRKTLELIAGVGPAAVAPTHFGVHRNVDERRQQLADRLAALEARVEEALARGNEADALDYEEEVRAEQSAFRTRELVDRYFDVFPAATDWAGVKRWVEKGKLKARG